MYKLIILILFLNFLAPLDAQIKLLIHIQIFIISEFKLTKYFNLCYLIKHIII